jgi:hypothetical protein
VSGEVACADCGRLVRVRSGDAPGAPLCSRCAALRPAPRSSFDRRDDLPLAEEEPARASPTDIVKERRGQAHGGCPECGGHMRPGDVLCVECGYDVRLGRQRGTRVRRFRRSWETGQPLAIRLLLLLGGGVFLLLALAGALLTGGTLAAVVFVMLLSGFFLSLVVFGWSATVVLERDRDGRLTVSRSLRLLFVPVNSGRRDLSRYQAVVIDAGVYRGPDESPLGQIGLVALGLLFFPVGIILVRYYLVTTGGGDTATVHCRVWLRGKRARDDLTLYRGWSEDTMRELVEAFSEVGGLEIKR